ncbi:sensor histidine kinase [Desulfovermiculus halophilus]|jgi:signal transduction histidine kinase|uniref:sensor histidine kinase n=1 Tax=Desulfovermiculus halophilus TaxID=339722 RepID=UPI0004811726|nr:ATP-binding protein [Desulfovermiculus halophilus]
MDISQRSGLHDLTFKSIIDALPCYLMIQDKNFNILFANHSFQSDFGANALGKQCYAVLKGVHHQCPDCPVRDTFRDKGFHVSEEMIYLQDGTVFEMLAFSAPLFDVVGDVAASIKLLANVGTIKNMHRELVTLGQSIALLSHDIKNILEGLHGGMYLMEEGIHDLDQELSRNGLDMVKRNVTEITRITQNILYSAKDRQPAFQEILPADLARQAGQLYADKAQSIGVQLQLQVNPDVPAQEMDPAGISRTLSNLVWNALQACQQDMEKSKHSVYLRLDFYDDFHFMFEVEDNARGMDSTTKENIFAEFYSTKGHTGTGLGLMVVERIVKNHHGKIEVLAKPEKGSLFRIIFPIQLSAFMSNLRMQ